MHGKNFILGVDDEPINQVILGEMLNEEYELDCLLDGESCIDAIQKRVPDLILLDVNMPGMNGLEVCQKLRELDQTQDVPIIFVSALSSPDERLAGYKAGGDDYITKPFVEEELLQKIRLQLQNQKEKLALKETKDATMGALMSSLSSSDELRVILQFIQRSYRCHDMQSLTNSVFKALAGYALEGSMLLTIDGQHQVFFSDDIERNLEKEVLLHLYHQEKIFSFGKRTVLNGEKASILVRNMPDNEEVSGRYKKHLAILMDALDERIYGIEYELDAIHKQQIITELLALTQKKLKRISEQNESQRARNALALSKLTESIENAFIHLGLNEEQEAALLALVTTTEMETDRLYEEGLKTDEELKAILHKLSDSL